MKKILLILSLIFLANTASASSFCEGYKRGYIQGYMRAHNTNLKPLTPLCPLKPLKGFGDPKDDYEFGYLMGLEDGARS